MKKYFLKLMFAVVVVTMSGVNVYNSQKKETATEVVLANVEALAADPEYFEAGTCYGTGAGFTNQYCYGGYTICCWAHTSVFGKN